tara:strand:+ start:3121 stop:3927 length:807 start_codon:yes stop_codon:yes gene_type:complete
MILICKFLSFILSLRGFLSRSKNCVYALLFLVFFFNSFNSFAQETVTPRIVKKIPHDSNAFTQGFIVDKGVFYESTGLYGSSSLRKYNAYSGKLIKKISLEDKFFAEGLTLLNDKLYQLTWKSGVMFVYDKTTFEIEKILQYGGEGWGLTHNDKYLVMSNGSNTLKFRDPKTLRLIRSISVTHNGLPVKNLNELEFIGNEIWANIWKSDLVACINSDTGKLVRWIDFTSISEKTGDEDVLNGIAYDKEKDKIFVTGKFWNSIYEVSLN